MTDEIIKALERMSEEDPEGFSNDILDLINRQQAEIDRLNTLAELGNMRANDYRAMRNKAKTAKAEAIKEFADKLKAKADVWEDEENYFKYVTTDDIDNLVKEMVGADNEQI